jgi:hypothetical protein
MWVESLACLVFVASLIPFLRFPSFAMASGSKEGESRVTFRLWLFRARALVCLYLLDLSISFVLTVTTAPFRTLEMS